MKVQTLLGAISLLVIGALCVQFVSRGIIWAAFLAFVVFIAQLAVIINLLEVADE